jgi:hypothetical protein
MKGRMMVAHFEETKNGGNSRQRQFSERGQFRAGLPDGFTFVPKIQIWVYFGGLRKENIRIFYDHLE